MNLTAPDEFFNHQVAYPHAVVSNSDPAWRERYWISLHDVVQRNFILSAGFGKYPNQDVMEAFVIVQHGSTQRNLRLSRQLTPGSDQMAVGCFSVEVVEPLKTLRFRLGANPSGILADFTWHASMPAMLEHKHFEVSRTRVSHDLIRYVQLGRISGQASTPEGQFVFTPESTWAERDHSWGVRPMAPVAGEPPVASVAWNFLAFCPLQFSTFALHFYLFESQQGRPTHLSACMVHADGKPAQQINWLDHDLEWVADAPVKTLKGGRVTLHFDDGRPLLVELSALPPRVYLRGGGYGVDQGRWKGETHLEHEAWDLSVAADLKGYAASSADHMLEARCAGESGFGIIEYMVRRGHQRYGGGGARPAA